MKAFQTAFLAAQKEFLPAVKDCVNPGFNSRYASLESILDAIKPALNKHGITISMPMKDDVVYVIFTHAESGEAIESHSKLDLPEKDKTNEQKIKSAITYKRRTNLEGLAGVVATDDDDAQAAVQQPTESKEYLEAWNFVRDVAMDLGLHESIKAHLEEYKKAFSKAYSSKSIKSRLDMQNFLNKFVESLK